MLESFKFALLDSPGPIYDGFLGPDALITERSAKEMLLKSTNFQTLDILTGINTVEGFSFEGYFSTSVKFWTKLNLTSELALTLERFSLLTRDKCHQNLIIDNRLRFDNYYEEKMKSLLEDHNNLSQDEVISFILFKY